MPAALVLDAHIAPVLAKRLNEQGLDTVTVLEWQGGRYRAASDEELLEHAALNGRILVTYDCRTIPMVLKEWAETGLHHGGVVFIDDKTLRPDDIGGLVRALHALLAQHGESEWIDRAVYLRSTPQ